MLNFRKFRLDTDPAFLAACRQAAVEKLQTLHPTHRLLHSDELTLAIETDSLYATDGREVYELGLVDDEVPAMRSTLTDLVTTFRL